MGNVCHEGAVVSNRCFHGDFRTLRVACQKMSCPICQNNWRRRVRSRIVKGVHEKGLSKWMFVTLTFGSKEVNGMVDLISEAMERWTKFRKWLQRSDKNVSYYRIVEMTKRGWPHFHILTDANLPPVEIRGDNERKSSYLGKQTPEGLALITMIESMGFGYTVSVQKVKGGSLGCAKYMSKYMSKDWKAITRPDGRSIRLCEGSRNWAKDGKVNDFFFERSELSSGKPESGLSCICGSKHKKLNVNYRRLERNVANGKYWDTFGRHRQSSGLRLHASKEVVRCRAVCRSLDGGFGNEGFYRAGDVYDKSSQGEAYRVYNAARMKVSNVRIKAEEEGNHIPMAWLQKNIEIKELTWQ